MYIQAAHFVLEFYMCIVSQLQLASLQSITFPINFNIATDAESFVILFIFSPVRNVCVGLACLPIRPSESAKIISARCKPDSISGRLTFCGNGNGLALLLAR
jgi:hypothetical protein